MAKATIILLIFANLCTCSWSLSAAINQSTTTRLPLHHRYGSSRAAARLNSLKGDSNRMGNSSSKLATLQSAVDGSFARAKALMMRNKKGVEGSRRSLSGSMNQQLSMQLGQESGDYVEPVASGGGDYLTEIELGNPPTSQIVLLDTGSDLVWVQCTPCIECFEQEGAIFNPQSSSSYQELSCDSTPCEDLYYYECGYSSSCVYGLAYGDGSETIGDLALEDLTLQTGSGGTTTFEDFVFGCGYENLGTFDEADGMLGMGRGAVSLAQQLRPYISGTFAYCLVPYDSTLESTLVLGYGEVPSTAGFTRMLEGGPTATYYYVDVLGISVAGRRLSIPRSVFRFTNEGGGSIIDCGTTLTYLPTVAYERVVAAVSTQVDATTVESPVEGLGLCYDGAAAADTDFPSLVFHFEGADMSVPADNYMVAVDDAGTLCLIMADSGEDFTIIGNLQQQNFHVFYDLDSARIGFVQADCATL